MNLTKFSTSLQKWHIRLYTTLCRRLTVGCWAHDDDASLRLAATTRGLLRRKPSQATHGLVALQQHANSCCKSRNAGVSSTGTRIPTTKDVVMRMTKAFQPCASLSFTGNPRSTFTSLGTRQHAASSVPLRLSQQCETLYLGVSMPP